MKKLLALPLLVAALVVGVANPAHAYTSTNSNGVVSATYDTDADTLVLSSDTGEAEVVYVQDGNTSAVVVEVPAAGTVTVTDVTGSYVVVTTDGGYFTLKDAPVKGNGPKR